MQDRRCPLPHVQRATGPATRASAVIDEDGIATAIHAGHAAAIAIDLARSSGASAIQPRSVRDLGETANESKQSGQENCRGDFSTASHAQNSPRRVMVASPGVQVGNNATAAGSPLEWPSQYSAPPVTSAAAPVP